MADTLRETLRWEGTDSLQVARVGDLCAESKRDRHPISKGFVFTARVYSGAVMVFRSLDYATSVGSMDRGKELCELAIDAELYRRQSK